MKLNWASRSRQGQVLAELDQYPFVLGVRDAEAELSKAQAIVVERRANYERYVALYESNNASKAELDEARASFDSAKSQVEAAKAKLGLARRDLRKTQLRAPFNGTISVKEIEPYVEVPVGRAVFGLDGVESGFEVSAAVPDSLLISLSLGDEADVVFPTLNNRRVPGVTHRVRVEITNCQHLPGDRATAGAVSSDLRSGMSVEVAFEFIPESETGEPIVAGLAVPLAAILVGEEKTHFVFIYDEKSSTVKKTQVKALNLRENDVIVEPGTLKAGDIIATAGVHVLERRAKSELDEGRKEMTFRIAECGYWMRSGYWLLTLCPMPYALCLLKSPISNLQSKIKWGF